MSASQEPVRVLFVDYFSMMRQLLTSVLSKDPEIEVVGTAPDGQDRIRKFEFEQSATPFISAAG